MCDDHRYELGSAARATAARICSSHHPAASALDTSHVQAALFGGAPVPPELAPILRELFPNAALINGFGCTESTGVLTALPDELAISCSGAIGLPMPAVEVELRDPDRSGAGELYVRGASIMAGYWNGTGVDALPDGWVSSGDIARRDEYGVLWIVDRAKDRISRGGEKVFSIEVENVIIGAPGVFEVAVVGVPDRELGERIGAVVHAMPGHTVDPEKVAAYAREHLPKFKRPEFIHVSGEPLPRKRGREDPQGGPSNRRRMEACCTARLPENGASRARPARSRRRGSCASLSGGHGDPQYETAADTVPPPAPAGPRCRSSRHRAAFTWPRSSPPGFPPGRCDRSRTARRPKDRCRARSSA
ncbi:fatty acid--CoA ligase family protein [Dactylosporangium sp. NPDC000244]|uniref:class I adenylate-forming enzyme family protein n=1 Tax=Dactylosporangium sp. NPDC000244 TaxID=3154365 RepID=UPI003327AC32